MRVRLRTFPKSIEAKQALYLHNHTPGNYTFTQSMISKNMKTHLRRGNGISRGLMVFGLIFARTHTRGYTGG